MKKLALFLLLFGFALSAIAEVIPATLIKIYDGDTVTVMFPGESKPKRVRLYGIDAPEMDQPGGKEAREALVELIGKKEIAIDSQGTDVYGRTIGIVLADQQDLCLEMLKLGRVWYYREYAKQRKDYAEAEAKAKEQKLGIWGTESPVAPWTWRKQQREKKALEKASKKTTTQKTSDATPGTVPAKSSTVPTNPVN